MCFRSSSTPGQLSPENTHRWSQPPRHARDEYCAGKICIRHRPSPLLRDQRMRDASGTAGAPVARTNAGRTVPLPCPAGLATVESAGAVRRAWTRNGGHADVSGTGHMSAHRDGVEGKRAAGGIQAAPAHAETDVDGSAMAACRHCDHAPASIIVGRHCGWRHTQTCGNSRQNDSARAMTDHKRPYCCCWRLRGYSAAKPHAATVSVGSRNLPSNAVPDQCPSGSGFGWLRISQQGVPRGTGRATSRLLSAHLLRSTGDAFVGDLSRTPLTET